MIYQQMQIVNIGAIVRTHGVKGAVVVRLTPGNNPASLEKARWCFLMIRNKPVPFEIEEILATGDDEVVLTLEGINDKPKAETILNTDIALEIKKQARKKKSQVIHDLLGFSISSGGEIVGQVKEIEDTGKQLLFVIEDEKLIPAHEDLIESIDEKQKIIYMDLPEGLLN
jgi:16S rRNA processing protein RimM